jgi:membrane protease YdiL (CAAX protease family)
MPTKPRPPSRSRDSESTSSAPAGLTGAVTVIVGALVVAYLFITNGDQKYFEPYQFINTGLCFWVPMFTILFVLRAEPADFGLCGGDRRLGWKWALFLWLAMLPLVFFAARLPVFREQYLNGRLAQQLAGVGPVFDGARVHLKALVYYELGMGFYFFCWEFFFRGFLLFGLMKTRLGTWGAVAVQALPFMLLHWSWQSHASKPYLEVLGSLPAAIILGLAAVRTRSFVHGYIAHWGVATTLDLCLLAPFIRGGFG